MENEAGEFPHHKQKAHLHIPTEMVKKTGNVGEQRIVTSISHS
jgi:hypothetical protein